MRLMKEMIALENLNEHQSNVRNHRMQRIFVTQPTTLIP